MLPYTVCEVPTGIDWVFDALHELEVVTSTELMGEDLAVSAEWNRTSHANERTALKGLLVAVPGEPDARATGRFGLPVVPAGPVPLLGAVQFMLPVADNQHLVDDVYCQVHPDARRRGIGAALCREVIRIGAAQGRTAVVGWSEHRIGAADDGPRLRAREGDDDLPLDRGSRFAQSLGASLAQVERQSRLELPVPTDLLAELRAEAEQRALPAYRVVSWVGPTPPEYRGQVAAMNRALSTDAPLGEIDFQPENWDAERVRHSDEVKHRTGHSLYSIAEHVDTGEVAGLTELFVHDAHPHRPEQWTTVVAREHRGHRLGLLLKVANLDLLAAEHPDARQVDTWNAGENAWMLGINVRLGFRPFSANGAWQLKLT